MRSVICIFLLCAMQSIAPAAELTVDLGRARSFDERLNLEMRRIGFDVRPAAARPNCTASSNVTCNMRVGSTMGIVIGTDKTGEKVQDVTLVKTGTEEGVAWINTMTALIAMFEPNAKPTAVREALTTLSKPMTSGKSVFSASHDMPNTHLTMNAHPSMGIVLTLEPR